MGALAEMLGAAYDSALKREYLLTKIRHILDNYESVEPETQHLMGLLQDVLLEEDDD